MSLAALSYLGEQSQRFEYSTKPHRSSTELRIYIPSYNEEPQCSTSLTSVISSANLSDASAAVALRILSFSDLQDGWMGTGSKAADIGGLRWLAEQFAEKFKQPSTPAVFLTPDGDVEMEWRHEGRSACATVSLSSRMAEWYSFFPEDNHDERDYEETLALDRREGWKRLNDLIQSLFSIE
jgi:hypothetical protein